MSLRSTEKNNDLIPLSTAVHLVSYSRDYIGRLAREGKVQSEQIDKQWFVSRSSLLNFFEHSTLEDSAKKKILSLSRKNDLEVKDFYVATKNKILARQSTLLNPSLFLVVMIIFGGLCGGWLVNTSALILASNPNVNLSQVVTAYREFSENQSYNLASSREAAVNFGNVVTHETTDKIPMESGIVVFPSVSGADETAVTELFSDEVTVVVTGTTTGFIRATGSDRELPFVRVPKSTP